ncbi:glycoside hydrolase family 18 protein [Nocardiopsis trehalosi]|uniref:glycoside hydrolase family 18 protein n=1 Tax=Nocardiopsis trehalosi TaxID=109329 RepID=UPI000829CA19|nr:glycoside hydrolase family 18 protein [Nocardiopsis trehalosi]
MRIPRFRPGLAAALGALLVLPLAAVPAAADHRGPGHGNGHGGDVPYRQVGYFTQWGPEDRGFTVKDLADSGTAERLTHLNYAFGNLDEDGECFMTDEEGRGDAYADYGRPYRGSESVDGRGDRRGQPLRGNFNQLRELKRENPDLKVYIALGGWAWSDNFSTAALPENRERAVESCIDLFLRGDLPRLNGAGGRGAAKGLFDGIDLDWEWPATEGEPGNVIRPEDRENYTGLVAEFRRQLDELGEERGRHYGLTAFVPASTAAIDAGYEIPELMPNFDFVNVQGYDLAGAWDPATGLQSNLRAPDRPGAPERSVETVVQAYVDRGADPADLVLGVPFYGRGWTGVEPGAGGDGLYAPATGAAPGEYEAGYNDYRVISRFEGFEVYRDEEAGAAWLYNGEEFWTFDDPAVIAGKAEWARENGLGGVMAWSLDGDDAEGSLYDAIDGELNGADGDHDHGHGHGPGHGHGRPGRG